MKNLIVTMVTAAGLLLIPSAPAQSNPENRTEFEGFIYFCSSGPTPDTKVIETPGGNTLHLRNLLNVNEWVTGNAYIDGPESNVPNINLNPVGGTVHLDVTLSPSAYSGTWEISQTLLVGRDGSVSSHGVGYGTGDLQGMIIKYSSGGPGPVEDNPCSEDGGAPVTGVIISP